jgi:orotidine-5'-phosphate decarboxylase
MADTFFERLESAVRARGALCIGLDPSHGLLDAWGLPDDAAGVERLARTAIEAVGDLVGVVKCQVAFYEAHGSAGFAALERVLAEARDAGLVVIGDAKRGDIGSTNEGYARAWLSDDSPLRVDAMTVTAYLGVAALQPVFELAHATGRGVFTVVASSNDEGRALQTARDADGRTVESALLQSLGVMSAALDRDRPASRCLGAVLGAQRRPDGLAGFTGPVLIPGMGAQGSDADDVAGLRACLGHDAVAVNVSRAALAAGPSTRALRDVAQRLNEALR